MAGEYVTWPGGTYLGALARGGYLLWLGGTHLGRGGTYLGCGYLPWPVGTYVGQGGVLSLAKMGYPPSPQVWTG